MKKKSLYILLALVISCSLFVACGEDETVEVVAPIESEETVEPVETVTEEIESVIEESTETVEEVETVVEETVIEEVEESDYTIESMDDTTMYCIKNCNVRSGPATTYDKVDSLTWGQVVTVNGKVVYEDSTWYVLKTENNEIKMVSASLLSTTKPTANTSNNGNSNNGNNGGGSSNNNGNSGGNSGLPAGLPTGPSGGGIDWGAGIGDGNGAGGSFGQLQ